MKPSVGLIGLGLMGHPIAVNVLNKGFSLTVWNRTASRAQDLVSQGARLAATPHEAAAASDVLLMIVSDPPSPLPRRPSPPKFPARWNHSRIPSRASETSASR